MDNKIKSNFYNNILSKIVISFIFVIFINLIFITPFNQIEANNYFKESITYLKNQENIDVEPEKKRVLAFYYSWYRLREVSNHKSHWNKINKNKKEISDSAHY